MTTNTECTTLPVLWGSRVQNNIDVGGRFRVVVFASNRWVDVSLDGAAFVEESVYSIAIDQLVPGYRAQRSLEADNGKTYDLFFTAECQP